jgi:hypothetical protein
VVDADRMSVCKFLTNAKITIFYRVVIKIDLSMAATIKLLMRDRKLKLTTWSIPL